MKITKTQLKQIIEEEIEQLDEFWPFNKKKKMTTVGGSPEDDERAAQHQARKAARQASGEAVYQAAGCYDCKTAEDWERWKEEDPRGQQWVKDEASKESHSRLTPQMRARERSRRQGDIDAIRKSTDVRPDWKKEAERKRDYERRKGKGQIRGAQGAYEESINRDKLARLVTEELQKVLKDR